VVGKVKQPVVGEQDGSELIVPQSGQVTCAQEPELQIAVSSTKLHSAIWYLFVRPGTQQRAALWMGSANLHHKAGSIESIQTNQLRSRSKTLAAQMRISSPGTTTEATFLEGQKKIQLPSVS